MIPSPILLGTRTERDGATRVGLVRTAIGTLGLLVSRPVRALFGVPDRDDTPAVRALARLFGVRNVALGALLLAVRDADPALRRRVYQVNAAVDAVDVAALLLPVLRRQGLDRFGLSAAPLGTAALLAFLELVARQDAERARP